MPDSASRYLKLQGTGSEGFLMLQAYVYTGREALSMQNTGSTGVLKLQPYIQEQGHRILSLIKPTFFSGDYLMLDDVPTTQRKVIGVPDPWRSVQSGKRV